MKLTGRLFAALLCALCSTLCLGQDAKGGATKPERPDFSGTWAFDGSRSNLPPQISSAVTEWTLVISQREPEVKADETIVTARGKSEVHSVQYTDGRPVETRTHRCKSKWDKTRLVRKCENLEPRGGENDNRFTERWELSADGRTLMQRVTVPPLRVPREADNRLPPVLREGAERRRNIREILDPPREIKKVFRRVS